MTDYILYAYFRSSCSARLRIILNLKNISYDHIPINLLKDEQLSAEHKALNPSASVPLLVSKRSPDEGFKIGQSVAALEYLEEVHPEVPTLPAKSDAKSRATVRVLCEIIAADTQPVTNLRIMRRVRALGGSAEEWNKELMGEGLKAYEAVVKDSAGKYSVGDTVTMADACLMPAVWNAQRFGVDLAEFPTISKVVKNLSEHPAVLKADYFSQPDCPEELRKK
ncbi:glutathione S-transferase [Pochonia chlamydosporia 170]|uniref:Glutathione S-transferase n=1 Tax=Pochonia chlamydosporia 170 TaxID=1380566 RepID=A0A179FZL6_METCM|nr:glutathione S-transferase [Pochonia chlamydosporia 170]OAQ70827.1 glutathione S-transferase [Pochonia chlamydosporia 170]